PAGYDPAMPDRLRKRLENTGSLPVKLHHTFEAVAEYCPVAARPVPAGLLGSSPGATAAWIARAPATAAGAAARELEATAARYGWLVPETAPVTAFERLL